jgi:hypothetical protein
VNDKIVTWVTIGLIVGLVLITLVGVFFIPQLLNGNRTSNNQVQVSGLVSETQSGIITFSSANRNSYKTLHIDNGRYSVVLTGGETYKVTIESNKGVNFGNYSLYVPIDAGNFTANF